MSELNSPSPELSQGQIEDLLGLVDEATNSPFAEKWASLPGVHLPACTPEAAQALHGGALSIEERPQFDPHAFLGVRYREFGPQFETEKFYGFHRDSEGKLHLRSSDTIDLMETNRKIHDPTTTREELGEDFNWEDLQVDASMDEADKSDYDTLVALFGFGLQGNAHDLRSDEERSLETRWRQEQHSDASRPGRISRILRRLFR